MEVRMDVDQHIEVHKYNAAVIAAVVILALLFQAFLPLYLHWTGILELPLLVTIYFALSRRNASSGLLLGMAIGLAQDSLSHTPIGLYGIAKTLVGFVASSIGIRIDVDHPLSRFLLVFCFFHFHNAVFVFTERALLARHNPYLTPSLLVASLINAAVAMFLYHLLDRLRKPS